MERYTYTLIYWLNVNIVVCLGILEAISDLAVGKLKDYIADMVKGKKSRDTIIDFTAIEAPVYDICAMSPSQVNSNILEFVRYAAFFNPCLNLNSHKFSTLGNATAFPDCLFTKFPTSVQVGLGSQNLVGPIPLFTAVNSSLVYLLIITYTVSLFL